MNKEKYRKTGIDVIGNAPWGTHFCQFYKTKEDLIDILVPYFKAGLENNEFCMWVTSEPLSEEEAKKAMRKAVPNFNKYLKKGQIEIILHTEWYLKGGTFNLQRVLNAWIDKLNQALARGYDGIRVTGNTAWLEKKDWRNFSNYEEEVNNAISEYQMIAICTYSLDKCGASEIIDVVNNHQFALIKREGKWEIIESSEHKKMDGELRLSGEILANMAEGVCLVRSSDGMFVYTNPKFEKMFGYGRGGLIGKNVSIVNAPSEKTPEETAKEIIKSLNKNGVWEGEVHNIKKDGTTFWCYAKVSTFKHPEYGQVWVAVHTDITERKKAEEELKEGKEKISNILASSPDSVTVTDLKGSIVECNQETLKLLGFSSLEEAVGKCVFPFIIKKDRKRAIENTNKILKEGITKNLEYTIINKKGATLVIEVSTSVIKDPSGKPSGFVAITKDITERKKVEEKIKSLKEYNENIVANIPSPIVVYDKNLKIVSANYTFYKTYKETPEKVIGKTVYKILPPDLLNKAKFDKKILKAFKTGKIIEDFNFGYDSLYVGKRIMNIKYIPIAKWKLAEEEEEEYVMVMIEDITEMKKLEKDKKTLSEKVTKLTKKIPLTQNEKLVFYGLVKYPLLNDQQLSDKLKIKRSTITAIKNKLLRQGFYSTYAIPNFALIGCELMCILSGKAPIENIEERKKSGMINKIMSSPEIVYHIATDKDCLGIIVSKNFIETKRLLDYISSIYEQNNNEMPHPVYFPFAMSKLNLFDYSGLFKSLFNLKIKEETNTRKEQSSFVSQKPKVSVKPIISTEPSTKRELTDNEKIILYALTKYPDLTDIEVAAKTKISRQTVSQIKKNLVEENFLSIINLPDIKKLGCELLVYSNAKIDLKKASKQNPELPSLIFMVNSERESSAIFIFENYTEHKIAYDRLTNLLKKRQFIIGEPTRHLFPIQQIKFQKIDFAPLVKKIFELKVDF